MQVSISASTPAGKPAGVATTSFLVHDANVQPPPLSEINDLPIIRNVNYLK
jgi:hypothetical protein